MSHFTINDLEYTDKDVQRFWVKVGPVDPNTGCMIWKAHKLKEGYGRFGLAGKSHLAHRLAWLFSKGSIPDNLFVCHRCDNPSCCNPDHLFLGTASQNSQDRNDKGRAYIVYGEAHHNVKLSTAQVNEIKTLLTNSDISKAEIARRFNVSRRLILNISKGETRKYG